MRLRAIVRGVTGRTTHLRGVPVAGSSEVTKLPDPKAVEIVEQDGGFYLLYLDGDGECTTDTWHQSLEAAKAQANFEFGLEEGDWTNTASR